MRAAPAGKQTRAISRIAALDEADMVVSAISGAAGLLPTYEAICAGKDIALANKETLVMAGELIMARANEKNVSILPVDSEHSAIFQSLMGNRRQDLKKIFLTASFPFISFSILSSDVAVNVLTFIIIITL